MRKIDKKNELFARVDIAVLHSCDISVMAKVAYAELVTYSDWNTGRATVRVRTIAEAMGVCERTVRKALKELREKGLIEVHHNRVNGNQGASTYILLAKAAEKPAADGGAPERKAASVQESHPAESTPCTQQSAGDADHIYKNDLLQENIPPVSPKGEASDCRLNGGRGTQRASGGKKRVAEARRACREKLFEIFWSQYPKKSDKNKAHRAFMGLFPDDGTEDSDRAFILENVGPRLAAYIAETRARDARYIKTPANWLRDNDFSQPPEEGEVVMEEVYV